MKIKILFIITTFQKDGPGNYLKYLVKYLDKSKFEIYACCLHNNGEIQQELENLGVKTFVFDMKSFIDISIIWKLKRLITEIKPDIVNTILLRADLFGRTAAIGKCKVLLSTILNQDDYRQKTTLSEKILMHFDEKLSNKYTNKIIVEAVGVKEYCIKYQNIDEEKYEVINSLIDVNEIPKNIKILPFESKDKIIIGTAGRLHPQKGQEYLIEAFKSIANKYPNALLYIYGSGELEGHLRDIVGDNNLNDRIFFKGYTNNLYGSLSEMDIYVMPSMWEGGAPISVLSSMAVGLPIISTNVGGIDEFITDGDEGLLIDVNDKNKVANKLEKAIESLINDKDKAKKLGANAKTKLYNNFAADKIAKKYEHLCFKLLGIDS